LDAGAVASGYSFDFFGYLEGDGSTVYDVLGMEGFGIYTDLQSPFSGSGGQLVLSMFNTNVGLFLESDSTNQGATFTVADAAPSSVPEIDPTSLGSVLALVLGTLGLLECRRLKAA
jgi:hypothetical protein